MENSSGGMSGLLKGTWQLISSSSHSRTFSVLVLLVIMAAVPLTVFVSQQQQETRQRAEGTGCSVDSITGWPTDPVEPGTAIIGEVKITSTLADNPYKWIAATLDNDNNHIGELSQRATVGLYTYRLYAPAASTQNTHTVKLWVHRYDFYGQPVGSSPNVLCGEATFQVIAPPPAQTYEIHGTVWIDTDEDGSFDSAGTPPEQAKAVEINLYRTSLSQQLIGTETTSATSGQYKFEGLAAGTYTVTIDMSDIPGFSIVSGTYGLTDSKAVTITNTFADVSWGLKPIGGTVPGTYKISGSILEEVVGTTGRGKENVRILLTNSTGTGGGGTGRSINTGIDGSYSFDNLAPGNYTVTMIKPDGYAIVDGANPRVVNLTQDTVVSWTIQQSSTCTACSADINMDGKVNAQDFGILAGCIGKPPTGNCAKADIDSDGQINNNDLTCLQSKSGQTCTAPPTLRNPGDINGDRNINIEDYNTWLGAMDGTITNLGDAALCRAHATFNILCPDANGDGSIDILDFNIWFRAAH